MKLLLAVALLALPWAGATSAEPDRLSLLLGSRHLGYDGLQEVNPGLFLTWERRSLDLSVGVYRNSYGRTSVAATAHWPLVRWQDGAFGVFAGAAHYPNDGRDFAVSVGDVVPLAGVQLRHGPVFVQIIPMNGDPVDAVLSFGVTKPLR